MFNSKSVHGVGRAIRVQGYVVALVTRYHTSFHYFKNKLLKWMLLVAFSCQTKNNVTQLKTIENMQSMERNLCKWINCWKLLWCHKSTPHARLPLKNSHEIAAVKVIPSNAIDSNLSIGSIIIFK